MKIILITGASSGIGQATARALAQPGHGLVLCGRNAASLQALAQELQAQCPCHTLVFDVGQALAVQQALASLPSQWQAIAVLINNAGNAHGLAPMHTASPADWDAMLASNVAGLLHVSQAVMPGMVQRGQGHIVNVSSIAGRQVYSGGAVYCASKAAVDAITQGMRLDLNPHGIKVSSIAPGLVNTGFGSVRFKGDMEKANQAYASMQPLLAPDVAEVIRYMVMAPLHVNLADVLLLPTAQASATVVHRQL